MIGAGFWARYQLAGWREAAEMSRGTATEMPRGTATGGAECIAICNRTRSRAEELAKEFGIPAVYTEPAEMLRAEKPDVVDIVSAPDLHEVDGVFGGGEARPRYFCPLGYHVHLSVRGGLRHDETLVGCGPDVSRHRHQVRKNAGRQYPGLNLSGDILRE